MATVKRDGQEQPEVNLGRYLFGMALDLQLELLLIAAAIIFLYVPLLSETPVRPALGILVVLIVPGYSLIAFLFPGKADLGKAERIALSVGLSIAISSLIGLVLNYTPWGIKLDPLIVCITIFAVILILLANGRRNRLPAASRFSLHISDIFSAVQNEALPASGSRMERILSLALVLMVVLSIGLTLFVLSTPKQGEHFTEFYILSSTGKAENYPNLFYTGETKPIILGVVNHEYRNASYDIVVTLSDGERLSRLYANNLSLEDKGTWEQMISLQPDMTGNHLRMDFMLYVDGNMTVPYRDLHLWVNVSELDLEVDSY